MRAVETMHLWRASGAARSVLSAVGLPLLGWGGAPLVRSRTAHSLFARPRAGSSRAEAAPLFVRVLKEIHRRAGNPAIFPAGASRDDLRPHTAFYQFTGVNVEGRRAFSRGLTKPRPPLTATPRKARAASAISVSPSVYSASSAPLSRTAWPPSPGPVSSSARSRNRRRPRTPGGQARPGLSSSAGEW